MMNIDPTCNQEDQLHIATDKIAKNQRRTLIVIILTLVVMIIEIIAGYLTGSMALLADGYHMASHAGALTVAYIVYRLTQSKKLQSRLNFGTGKLLPLGGYSSALALGLMAIWMIYESITRFLTPTEIHFKEALIIATLGLITNFVSALILGWKGSAPKIEDPSVDHSHCDHDHGHDHNHESAVAHVLADALTSVLAITALLVGLFYDWQWLDPAMGILGALVILKWAYGLSRKTAWELLDGSVSDISTEEIKTKIISDGLKLHDFHLWKVGPQNYICIISVSGSNGSNMPLLKGRIRSFFPTHFKMHLVIENQ